MNTKELINIPKLDKETKATIWELNYGFKSDLQGKTTKIGIGKDTEVDFSNLRVYTLVYGIYKSEELGINIPKDMEMGLSPEETRERVIAVRKLNADSADFIYTEINAFNTEVEDEVLKKSSSPLTEKESEIQE